MKGITEADRKSVVAGCKALYLRDAAATLLTLSRADGYMTVRDICAAAGLLEGDVTRGLKRLAAADLVTRRPRADGPRSKHGAPIKAYKIARRGLRPLRALLLALGEDLTPPAGMVA